MRPEEFTARHFRALAVAVLILAAFNLSFRVSDDAITEWDESLYGLSAAEMIDTGDRVATRLDGQIDYFVTKPPLMVWLLALSFKILGFTAVSLRLVSIVAAWLTVLVLMLWAKRVAGRLTAIVAGVVLATSFGFMFVHSGRTGNTDALFTLLTTLTAVVLYTSFTRPSARLVLGLLFAALFLLRGPGMLMPLLIVVAAEIWHRRAQPHWATLAAACAVFAIPVAVWTFARWRIDEWRFLAQVWNVDLVTRTLTPFEGHAGTALYYFDILQRYHYDWLVAAAVALLLFPPPRSQWREWLSIRRDDAPSKVVIASWAIIAFGIPTLMQTKLSWYLNPFYPVFALIVGGVLQARAGCSELGAPEPHGRAAGRHRDCAGYRRRKDDLPDVQARDASYSLQGPLERERSLVAGRTIFRSDWNLAERFVATRMIGSHVAEVNPADRFLEVAADGDFLVAAPDLTNTRLEKIRQMAGAALYRKTQ